MEQPDYKFVNFLFDGKMVTSKNAFSLGANEYQMVNNMRYVEDGIETRKGCSIHNATDVNDGSTTIKSIHQTRMDRYSLLRTIVQADDYKYYYDDDLPTAGAFTGLTMYPTTENTSALKAISCGVGEADIFCNVEENWVYHGTQPRPTAIFKYVNSATSYISYIDEMYSLKTSDVMELNSLGTSDYLYLGFWVPFSGAYFDLTTFNANAAGWDVEYFNGGWTDVSGDNDDTAIVTDDLVDDDFDDNDIDTDIWTVETGDGGVAETGQVLQVTTDSSDMWDATLTPAWAYQTVTGDFEIVVKMLNFTGCDFQGERCGVLVWDEADDRDWLSCSRYFNAGQQKIYGTDTVNDNSNSDEAVEAGTTVWFKISRTGSDFTCEYSTTSAVAGFSAVPRHAVKFTSSGNVKVGLYGCHYNGVQYTVDFDDFTVNSTSSSSATMAQDGLYSWTLPTDWVPTMVEGGLWYFLRMQPTGTLSGDVSVNNLYIQAPMQLLPNLWDQNWQPVSGAYHYDDSATEYKDYLPKVIDGVQATYMFLENFEGGADKDGIYIGTPYKPLAFRIKVDAEYTNVGNAEINVIEGWDGSAWDAGTGLSDTTKGGAADIASFSQNGIISFNNGTIAYKRGMLRGEDFPMYWTRLEIDADAVTTEIRIWDIAYVPDVDDPSGASACMEFKDRLLLVGVKDYPNEVWISAPYNHQGFNGEEFTKMVFGDGRKLTDGVPFFNEALVFKEDSTWLIQGFRKTGAGAFGRLRLDSRVGAFRKTAQLGRIWITSKDAAADDYRNVVFFQHRTGVYFSDGNKPIYISHEINTYFDENHADYVGAANIAAIDSWFDYYKDEYHLLFSTGLELVYNAWFKKWSVFDRPVDLKSGAAVVGSNGEPLTYGGTAIGKVMRLESDTSDKDSADADAAIDAHVIVKAQWPGELEHELNFRRLVLVAEGNNTNGGVITVDGAYDGGDITDNADAQYFTLNDTLDTDDTYDHRGYVKDVFSIGPDELPEACDTIQLKFGCDTIDLAIKLIGYGLGVGVQRQHPDE